MNWTDELPHESGWYWCKPLFDDAQPYLVWVYDGWAYSCYFRGSEAQIRGVELMQLVRKWAGPLEAPVGR